MGTRQRLQGLLLLHHLHLLLLLLPLEVAGGGKRWGGAWEGALGRGFVGEEQVHTELLLEEGRPRFSSFKS